MNQTEGWVLVSPRILLGAVGAVACFAWLFVLIGTSSYMPFVNDLGASALFVHLTFVAGCVCSLLLVWLFSDFLSRHRMLHFGTAVLTALFGSFGFAIPDLTLVWYSVLAAATGFGFGLLYVLYGEYIVLFFKDDIKSYVLGIITAAVLVCGGVLVVNPSIYHYSLILLPLVALVLYATQIALFRLDRQKPIKAKTSDFRSQVNWHSYVATATAGLGLGFALGCILSTQMTFSLTYLFIELGLLLMGAVLFIDATHGNKIGEPLTMRWFLPASAIIVFPMLFVSEEIQVVLAICLLVFMMFPLSSSISAMCQHIQLCRLSPIRSFGFGRLVCFVGILFGMVIGFIGFSDYMIEKFGSAITVMAVIAFMLIVIMSASFVMTEDNYPTQSRFKEVKAQTEDGEESILVVVSDLTAGPATAVGNNVAQDEESIMDRPRYFNKKCEAVAKKYDLSERQEEVLMMLAKGRNAEYITKKLIISSHTAKAHIYSIYQKTGVHSRQELMDLVEEIEAEEE